jgi:hypothetical protein
MHLGPTFFKEISFFDFLEELAHAVACATVTVWEGEIEKRDFSFPK